MNRFWLKILTILGLSGLILGIFLWVYAEDSSPTPPVGEVPATESLTTAAIHVEPFLDLLSNDADIAESALNDIQEFWQPSHTPVLIEVVRFLKRRENSTAPAVYRLLTKNTGQNFGQNRKAWLRWSWSQKFKLPRNFAAFKEQLYKPIDTRFAEYFDDSPTSTIQLDEVEWGGVKRDGIPPLKNPEVVHSVEASWLSESDVVFGVFVNGQARAYPQRILAWHEMVKDVVGGQSLCGVYCTLCGSMIIYETSVNGQHIELGTSGFLYRSNKLMYDHETKSLWSTLEGEPVVGPLVKKGIQLKRRSVVTTTWQEWKNRHPETTVLSLKTGHRRDYREGAAYRSYFATDKLMFDVSLIDDQLKNKEPVLALRVDEPAPEQLAITTRFLSQHPVYHDQIGNRKIVVITEPKGASRVYESQGNRFVSFDSDQSVCDKSGNIWSLSEDALTSGDVTLKRLPSHNAFWFGWYAAYPRTRLIKQTE